MLCLPLSLRSFEQHLGDILFNYGPGTQYPRVSERKKITFRIRSPLPIIKDIVDHIVGQNAAPCGSNSHKHKLHTNEKNEGVSLVKKKGK